MKNDVLEPRFGGWKKIVSEIILDGKYAGGLEGLADYSHAIIVFAMDRVKGFKIKHVPQGKAHLGVPEVGIFACRCPARPNPIAITTVEILTVGKTNIRVRGLDAVNGSPVLDIKPFTPAYDELNANKLKVRVPKWVSKLDF